MSGIRELAKIKRIDIGPEDHGIQTVWLHMEGEPGGGWGQGFGGISFGSGDGGKNAFDKKLRDHFLKTLFDAFGVADAERLNGRKAYVLRNWPHWNEPIVGLESVDTGRIFTIHDWRNDAIQARLLDKKFKSESPLGERRASLLREIEHHERRIRETRQTLGTLEDEYQEWKAH